MKAPSLKVNFCGVEFPNPFCLSSSPVGTTPHAGSMFRSVQLRGSRPGRIKASIKVRSKWMPSRLLIKTASDKPICGSVSIRLRDGTKRLGKAR